jgi:prolyl-tRNA synthetase
MKFTQLFTKTTKDVPADADSANAKYLVQGGFVRQEMAGVYSWLPLGLRALRKVEAIIREELDALGAQEVLMPALHPKESWMATGRWDTVDILFKLNSQTGKEYALGPSHEEIVTPLVASFVQSYQSLPLAVYQIQSKFRDELRAKSGVLRGREFGMKDLYSFHASQADLEAFYQKVLQAYIRIFQRCGLDVKVTEASGGSFTKKLSHEFQVVTSAGEDDILCCASCTFAQNVEVATVKDGDKCPSCGGAVKMVRGVEAGNIFDLGTKFSEDFKLEFTDEDGSRKPVVMGCYGIGTTRLVGTIVEASHDAKGIIWPRSIAPFPVQLVTVNAKDDAIRERVTEVAQGIHDDLIAAGVDVLWDDRTDVSPGEKFADADLLGMPLRLVISERSLKDNSVEWKLRASDESKLVGLEDVMEEVSAFIKE